MSVLPGHVPKDRLPSIMVAPNGATRTKADHPALPVTIEEIVETAHLCRAAGAGAIHAHVRDDTGRHTLDAGLYRELLMRLEAEVPGFPVQITTEAAGRYTPFEQIQLVRNLKPRFISAALREITQNDEEASRAFYRWAASESIVIQHILYSSEELERFLVLANAGFFGGGSHLLLFVLGRYSDGQQSKPENLHPFLDVLKRRGSGLPVDWAVCAFGKRETDCLVEARRHGGKMRIGFENGLWNRDGSLARDNAERVRDLVSALEEFDLLGIG